MSSKLELKLDTDAIIALIGDDPDTRARITSSIVQQFTEKYLKGIANREAMQETERVIMAGIRAEVAEQVGKTWPRVELGEKIKDKLQETVKQEIESQIGSMIRVAVEEKLPDVKSWVESIVESSVNDMATREIKRQVLEDIKNSL